MADRKKLEELFIALVLEDKQLETQYRQVVTRAKEVAKEIQTAIAGSLGAGLVDDTALDAAFQSMQAKAQAAAQAVERAAKAQQKEAQSTKAAADTIAQAVDATTKATESAARAATSAMSDLGATAGKAADAADDLAGATRASAESGKAFSEWADSMRARLEALRQSVQRERESLEDLDKVQLKLGDTGEKLTLTQDELERVIASLSDQVRTSRNLWASRVTSDQEFQDSTRGLRNELLGLVEAGVLTEEQMRKVTQAAAFAQRGLDSAAGVASRGGLAWTTQIALANQFGQQLRNLGPAGQAAAGALGIFQSGLGNLQRPLTSADFQLSKLGSTLLRLPSLLALGTAALTVGMGVALGKLTIDAAKLALELEAMTFRTGMGAEAIQELQHAARQTGVQTEILGTTMQRLQRRAADANAGNVKLRESFRALGVTLTDSSGRMLDTMSLLEQVADGLASIDNDAERVRRAFQVFDTEGARLLPLLARGSAGIKELRQEARDLGLVISGDAVLSLAELQGKLETLKRQFEVTRVEVAAAFVPLLDRVLVPLLQTRVVPALQNVVTRVTEFSQSFFDQTEAGVAFRKDVVANLNAVIALGRGVVASAQAVAVAVNSIFSVTASIGSYIGNVTTVGMDSRTRQGLRDSLEQLTQLRDRARELGDTAAVERFNSQIAATNQLLGEMGSNWFTGIFRSGDDALNYAQNVLSSFDNMLNAITFDAEALLESVVSDFDPNKVRSALAPVADVIGGALGDGSRQALEGSLAHAQEQLQKAMDDFNFAATSEAREAAWKVVEVWQEAIRLIQLAFGQLDPLRDAKIWTGRLEAELREGVKSTHDVFMLLTAGIERTRQQASLIFDEFGWDSDEYREVIQKLDFLEAELARLVGKPKTLEIDVKTNILPISVLAVMPDFSIPTQAQSGIDGLVAAYRDGFLRIADAQAALNGVTLETRDTYQEALEVFEIALGTVQEGSAEYLTLADAIVAVRRRLQELDETLKTPPDLFRMPDLTLPAQEVTAAQAIVDAYLNDILKVVDLQARLTGVTQGTRDAYAEAAEIFEAILPTLKVGSDDWMLVGEALVVVRQRAQELEQQLASLSGVILPDFSLPAQDVSPAQAIVDAYLGSILKVADVQAQLTGVTEDTRRAYQEAGEIFAALLPTLEEGSDEWLAVAQALVTVRGRLEDLDTALGSVATTLDANAFAAWAQAVGRIGLALDPVTMAAADLGQLMADGKITAEEYAIGLNMVSDALDRLEQIEAQQGLEELGRQLADALGVDVLGLDIAITQWDQMREAAQAAFDAGLIGADQLRKALSLIGILELADGFRKVAEELTGTASIIPNLAADVTEAIAQMAAGNAAGGIATAFQAATAAVQGLGAAFQDTERQAEAMVDLVIGGAAAIATVIGGPALGQAVGAIGSFIKSVLGDLSNGLAAIEKQVGRAAASSKYLSEGLIRGIAEGATNTVSRGGLLGLLGFTKQELDEDAFRAGLSVAEGIANGLVGTLRSGDFEEAWQAFIDDILVQGVIEAFMATALVQNAIEEAMELIMGGNVAGGAAKLDALKEDFRKVWETIQSITRTPLPDDDELSRNVTFTLPDATVSVLAAPQWALELTGAAGVMREAGEQMVIAAQMMQDTFSQGIPVTHQSTRGIDASRAL